MAQATQRYIIITFIMRNDDSGKIYGFAQDEKGKEYFLSRGTIQRNNLTGDDVGRCGFALTAANPRPIPGQRNLDHVIHDIDFEPPAN